MPKDNRKNKTATPPENMLSEKEKYSNSRVFLLLFLLGFILYANTISHDYALDDAIVITDNEFTKQGFGGIKEIMSTELFTGFFGQKKDLLAGGRYRPLSLVTFAIEYELIGLNPHISHFINILLYILSAILLFRILTVLFKKIPSEKWYLSLPFWITILYIAHPLHTEVVANIKGRDEILALLFSLATFWYILKYIDTQRKAYLIYSCLVFFLGLLAKEMAITFVLTIPLAIYFFTEEKFKRIIKITVILVSLSVLYMLIRQSVLGPSSGNVAGELMNNPFINTTNAEKYATIFYTWGLYVKLLIFPHPLTFDYYPYHIPVVNWSDLRAISSFIFYLGIGIYALARIKKKSIIAFGILFYLISFSPVSNFIFPVGVFMNERFMYVASIGFVIILVYLISEKLPNYLKKSEKPNGIPIFIFIIILSLYSVKTISRNFVWKNNFVLFTTDVKVSSNGAKSNASAGGVLMEEAVKPENSNLREEYLEQAIQYLNKAVDIHPGYVDALLLLGNAHYEYNKNFEKAFYYYKRILVKDPNYFRVYDNISFILNQYDDVELKINVYEDLYSINPDRFDINYQLGVLYGRFKNDLQNSIKYLQEAIKIDPESIMALKDLGVAYGMSGQFANSVNILEKAIQLDPDDTQILVNLGLSYQNLGDMDKANEYFNRAKEIDPTIINNQ